MRGPHAARRMRVICRAFVLCAGLLAVAAHAQLKGDAGRGAAKAAACASCHGSPKAPPPAGLPVLAGQQQEFLVLQMILIREGLRDVPQMAGTLKRLSDTDFIDLAAYFGSQPPIAMGSKGDAKLRARGAELSKSMGCGSCHMGDYSGQRQVPRITNQREDYLAATLKAYRDNKRTGTDTSMNAVMYQVPDADIRALAHYLAQQK